MDEVNRLREAGTELEDTLTRRNATVRRLNKELDEEEKHREETEGRCRDAESENQEFEDQLRHKPNKLGRLSNESAEKDTGLLQKHTELERLCQEAVNNHEAANKDADLSQKTAELKRVKDESSRKDADLARGKTPSEQNQADLRQRDNSLALLLMGGRYSEQNPSSWSPLVECAQSPAAPALPSAIDQRRWWAAAPPWEQQITPTTHRQPIGVLEAIGVLYGEAVASRWTYHGCVALQVIIRYLEVTEVAPIGMILETLRRLLASIAQGDSDVDMISGFHFGTSQVIGLIQLRWPETGGLADIEGRCQQKMLSQSPPDLQLIYDLVAGAKCGSQVKAAFMNDDQARETSPMLLDIPHKCCPAQQTLLVAPPTPTSPTWALEWLHHEIWLVDKTRGDFADIDNYRLPRLDGEDFMVPSLTGQDLDFIFKHLPL